MGSLIITIAFIASLGSSILYFLNASGKGSTNSIKAARFLFHAAVVLTISSAAFLLYLIITHQFQYTYVWNYSSRDLPINLLISTFTPGRSHLWYSNGSSGIFLYLTGN
jgi:cytochrome c-type biogenesis protein CcmF